MIAYDAACIILVLDDIKSGGNSRLLRSETIGIDRLTWLLVDELSLVFWMYAYDPWEGGSLVVVW